MRQQFRLSYGSRERSIAVRWDAFGILCGTACDCLAQPINLFLENRDSIRNNASGWLPEAAASLDPEGIASNS
jgi:hypothetical protein